jgi:hypothetical protein
MGVSPPLAGPGSPLRSLTRQLENQFYREVEEVKEAKNNRANPIASGIVSI